MERYFAGRTQAAMAAERRVSQPMMSRRLAEAVVALRDKLKQQGLPVTAAVLTAGLAAESAVALPAGLAGKLAAIGLAGAPATVGAAAAFGVGGVLIVGAGAVGFVLVAVVALVVGMRGLSATQPPSVNQTAVAGPPTPDPAAVARQPGIEAGLEGIWHGTAQLDGETFGVRVFYSDAGFAIVSDEPGRKPVTAFTVRGAVDVLNELDIISRVGNHEVRYAGVYDVGMVTLGMAVDTQPDGARPAALEPGDDPLPGVIYIA